MRKRFIVLFLILCVVLVGCSGAPEHSAEQIKGDLIGHHLTTAGSTVWEFAALSEYEKFDIIDRQTQGDAIEYDVSMRLIDLASDTHFLAEVLVVYTKTDGKWELTSIVTKLFKRL